MRVLMTGMAARGIGSTKTRHKITSLPDVVARALRDLGHEVEGPRRVRMGEAQECLREADVVLVQLGWASSLSSTYGHEAGYVMALAERLGVPIVRYVDDWRSQWLADDIAGHVVSAKGWRKHTESFRRDVYSSIQEGDRQLIRDALAAPVFGAPLLVPIMGWGDPSKFDVSRQARLSRVDAIDPQALCDRDAVPWEPDEKRLRRWVCASLQEHDRWIADQGLEWPVLRLGANPKLPGGVPVKGGKNAVVPEAEVLREYGASWGVLSPEYASAGSGYWRTRFDQAMNAGAVLWPGATDSEQIAGAFSGLQPAQVEALSTASLGEYAAAQAATLDAHMWGRERALTFLDEYIRAAE